MISCKKILRPYILLMCIVVSQFVVYGLYVFDFIKSFRITFVATSVIGYIILLLFYLIQIFVVYVGSRVSRKKSVEVECLKPRKIIVLVYIYMAVSFAGLIRLTSNLVGVYGIRTLMGMIVRNRHLELLVHGSGNTIFCIFSQVSLIMLSIVFDRRKKSHVITLILNFLLLIIYAGFLSSRILILEGFVFVLTVFFRKYLYEYKLKARKMVIGVMMATVLFVITSGYRDFDQAGIYYTESKIEWGISRLADYIISTMNTQLDIDEYMEDKDSSFPTGTFELASMFGINNLTSNSDLDWRMRVSAAEYTNIGSLSQIYLDFKMGFVIFVFLLAVIYAICWIKFDRGELIGYFLYPIFLYNILESWRIYLLGTTMGEILLVLSLFSYILCKGSFRENFKENL